MRNYQKELDRIIDSCREAGRVPRLLLHSCCAPCSSYVLEYLSQYFRITDYYYNPNITEADEYRKRADELARLIREQPHLHPVEFCEGPFEPERFFEIVRGYEDCPEGGERCSRCFRLRLFETAALAEAGHTDPETGEKEPYDFFTTTLTISPLKNAAKLNAIGEEAEESAGGAKWLPCDFKKKGGYQRSVELSAEYGLYRQDYCGCRFSKRHDLKL